MKKIVLTGGLVFLFILLLILLSPAQSNLLGNYTCPVNSSLIYFFQTGCSACTAMDPLINELPGKGCAVTKLNAIINHEQAIEWDVMYTPTIIICGERYVGTMTPDELKDTISNSCS